MRLAGTNGEATEKAIREAAVRVFATHGFQAASLRMIANEVGIQAPSLYNYIESKEQLLFELLEEPLMQMNADYKAMVAGVDDPFEKLRVFVRVHLDFHVDSRLNVFIGTMELRNLSPDHYKIITGLRDSYSLLLTDIIESGQRSGAFIVEDPRVTTFAVLAMLSGVCHWFKPEGKLSKSRIIEIHTRLAFEMLGVDPQPVVPRKVARKKATVPARVRA